MQRVWPVIIGGSGDSYLKCYIGTSGACTCQNWCSSIAIQTLLEIHFNRTTFMRRHVEKGHISTSIINCPASQHGCREAKGTRIVHGHTLLWYLQYGMTGVYFNLSIVTEGYFLSSYCGDQTLLNEDTVFIGPL